MTTGSDEPTATDGGTPGDGTTGDGTQGDGSQDPGQGDVGTTDTGSGFGAGSGGDTVFVTGSGAGTPPAPVEAPAAAASGPAPDAAAAAPEPGPVSGAFVAAGSGTDDTGGLGDAVSDSAPVVAAQDPAAAGVPTSNLAGLGGLPALGSIGGLTDRVTDGPSAARAVLSTGTGRSLTVIMALLVAIALFLAVHRRTDRGDRKLAAARNGPDVARFR